MHVVLKTMVTTPNQFCCLSHNSKAIVLQPKMNSFNTEWATKNRPLYYSV